MASPPFAPEGTDVSHLLVVSDLDRTRAFYRDVLGAELTGEYGGTTLVCKLFGTWLVLTTPGGPTQDKPDTHFVPPADADQVSRQIIFGVADCRGAYETLKSRGAAFLTPPVDHGYEIRCFFRDPDGHLFELSEHSSNV